MKITIPSLLILAVAGTLASCDAGQSYNRQQPATVQSPLFQQNNSIDTSKKQPPAGVTTTTTQQTALPQPQVVSNAKTQGAKLNPAHGQPGHRCEIPVGAPLNSAPASNPVGVSPVISPAANSTSPAQPQALPKGTVKLNPAHGQPGHDCNIPVGQPLRS